MCGITGMYHLTPQAPPALEQVQRMVAALTHRGPEQFGVYRDERVALGHARLSILDIAGGQQPLHNEDKTIWIVYNGETFNFLELREELLAKGHVFSTRTDTEVLVHLYEEEGPSFIARLNGQYAFALWDGARRQLMLGRDRVGIRPLYYTIVGGSLIFGSEVKALFVDPRVPVALDPVGLDQIFTFWATVPPRTTFKNVLEVPPAQYLIANDAGVVLRRYWDLRFPGRGAVPPRRERADAEQLEALLLDATRLRLRADVPVAAYLSGGLDSSLISALVKKNFNDALETFSVSFTDTDFDESLHQKRMADFLGTRHHTITCTYADVGEIMPEVVWHAEQPLIRTAAAPMYLLARLVREHHIKVVLTGEGADEVLGGYDLFKEMMIRRFWARNPSSKFRPQLLKKLYGYLPNWPRRAPAFLEAFYRTHLAKTDEPHYSHMPRWETTAGIKSFFSDDVKHAIAGEDAVATFLATLPAAFSSWDYLAQAQYLEMQTLLSGNLLSSQGDRMAMAHAVEGRYPFLDYRVIEFCAQLPPRSKLQGMNEKHLLKTVGRNWLPDSITDRVKQAYRSPDSASFFNGASQGYVDEVLSPDNIRRTGYFNPALVENLVKRCRSTDSASFSARHNMAITGIITTLLVDKLFVQRQGLPAHPGKAAFYIIDRVA